MKKSNHLGIVTRPYQPWWHGLRLSCWTESKATLLIKGALICNKTCICIYKASRHANQYMSAENIYKYHIFCFKAWSMPDSLYICIYSDLQPCAVPEIHICSARTKLDMHNLLVLQEAEVSIHYQYEEVSKSY